MEEESWSFNTTPEQRWLEITHESPKERPVRRELRCVCVCLVSGSEPPMIKMEAVAHVEYNRYSHGIPVREKRCLEAWITRRKWRECREIWNHKNGRQLLWAGTFPKHAAMPWRRDGKDLLGRTPSGRCVSTGCSPGRRCRIWGAAPRSRSVSWPGRFRSGCCEWPPSGPGGETWGTRAASATPSIIVWQLPFRWLDLLNVDQQCVTILPSLSYDDQYPQHHPNDPTEPPESPLPDQEVSQLGKLAVGGIFHCNTKTRIKDLLRWKRRGGGLVTNLPPLPTPSSSPGHAWRWPDTPCRCPPRRTASPPADTSMSHGRVTWFCTPTDPATLATGAVLLSYRCRSCPPCPRRTLSEGKTRSPPFPAPSSPAAQETAAWEVPAPPKERILIRELIIDWVD